MFQLATYYGLGILYYGRFTLLSYPTDLQLKRRVNRCRLNLLCPHYGLFVLLLTNGLVTRTVDVYFLHILLGFKFGMAALSSTCNRDSNFLSVCFKITSCYSWQICSRAVWTMVVILGFCSLYSFWITTSTLLRRICCTFFFFFLLGSMLCLVGRRVEVISPLQAITVIGNLAITKLFW